MPRTPRRNYDNSFYHVMNRGRNKENIFHDQKDFQLFLDLISQASNRFRFSIHSFCLMDNHYHLLLEDIKWGSSSLYKV